ncbi:MAG: cyclopropane-fatty-acyl-phospholipid synthase family protein [Gemmatimonadota bacterium]
MPQRTSFTERAVRARLALLKHGALLLRDGAATAVYGDRSAEPLEIVVHDRRFYPAVALGGHLGAAEAYAEGWWTTDDLTSIVRFFARNREAVEGLERGWSRLFNPLRRLANIVHRNTRRGARSNIRAHYDLGNEFFKLFLDDTMTYSCGLFDRPDASLHDASTAKYDRIASLVGLTAADHLLEIGTGWGGFAIHAATRYGCRVTTTTISAEQYQLARERVAAAGLADRITVLQQDYRDLDGTFDKLVSIEMIEAIGHDQYRQFFGKCASLVNDTGRVAIQAITIPDDRYDAARREVDFIKRYIFPGSCIPSRAVLADAAAATDLRTERLDEIGLHYAETLRRWRESFAGNRERISTLGFDGRFQRIWQFYFAYCEGGFLERAIGTVQWSFAKPAALAINPDRVGSVPPIGVAA